MTKFSIIIPCRDEVDNVEIITKNILDDCKYKKEDYEIIFINDFSSDQTLIKLEQVSNKNSNIIYFDNKKKGLGGAISLGLQKFQGNYVTIMMCDSADDVNDLNTYFEIMDENKEVDAVFGSRFIKGSETFNYPIFKLGFNRLGNFLTRLLFLSKYNDFTNSFKIYKKEVINHLHPIVSENFNIFLELPLKTISRGFNYKIIPIKYRNRQIGTAKFNIKELGSSYIFTMLYCFLEKLLLKTKVK